MEFLDFGEIFRGAEHANENEAYGYMFYVRFVSIYVLHIVICLKISLKLL